MDDLYAGKACCPEDKAWEARRKKEQAECDALKATPVEIDGIKLTLGVLFPDEWALKEFGNKLKLLRAGASGSSEGMDNATEVDIDTELYG